MTKLLLVVLAIAPLLSSAKDDVYGTPRPKKVIEKKENLIIPTKDGVIFYEQVAHCTDSQKELYLKARKWFVDTFRNANSVLQMDDKEDGKLAGKAFHTYSFNNGINTSNVNIDFTLNIDIKDGKYRVQFYDMYGANTNMNGGLAMLSALSGNYNAASDATTIRKVEYNQILDDYLAGKREKYNKKILDGMNNEVKSLFASLEMIMKTPANDDF
jgi:hypothetical protein